MPELPVGKQVLIVGGGVAGVSAAVQLSDAGLQVHLVERADHLGGHALDFGCKATDSCQKCNVCLALEKFRKLTQDPKIHLHLASELAALDEAPKNPRFRATIAQQPLPIDPAKCIACGLCASVCPAKCISQATPSLGFTHYTINRADCLALKGQDCRKCQDVCPTSAIDLAASPGTQELSIDAVLLAIGYEAYDPIGQGTYGYGQISNVLTGLDAECQLQKSGTIYRPSDLRPPQNLAFIQCVGSRSQETEPLAFCAQYCSAVCCAYAMRTGLALVQKLPGTKISIFYMDLQQFGKDYQSLYNDCRDKLRLIRSRPSRLDALSDDQILLTYEDVSETRVKQEQFDLVVLATGIRPPADARRLADMLDIGIDQHGFFNPEACYRPGIFLTGSCCSPADIAATIEQTSAVTSRLLDSLCESSARPASVS